MSEYNGTKFQVEFLSSHLIFEQNLDATPLGVVYYSELEFYIDV